MDAFCRWGMHRPGREKIFNEGRQFTRCSDCGTDLLETRRGWRTIPAGKVVRWRKRTSYDIFFVVTPNRRTRRLPIDFLAPFKARRHAAGRGATGEEAFPRRHGPA